MDELVISERRRDTLTILDLAGKIRIDQGNVVLRRTLAAILKDGRNSILLNMTDVTHVDSSGLGELVAGYVAVQKAGGSLRLFQLNRRVLELMTITNLRSIFDIYENEESAVNEFHNPVKKNINEQPLASSQGLDQGA